MATIQQVRRQIETNRQAIARAKAKARSIQTEIPVSRAELQKITREKQIARKLETLKLERQKQTALAQIEKQEQEFEQQAKPIEQKIEQIKRTPQYYIKEKNLKGKPVYDRVVKGGAEEVVAYKYSTPYGEYIDTSPGDYARQRERVATNVLATEQYYQKLSEIPQVSVSPETSQALQSSDLLMSTREGVRKVSEVYPQFKTPQVEIDFSKTSTQQITDSNINKMIELARKTNELLRKKITSPAFEYVKKRTGLDLTETRTQALFTPSIVGIANYGVKPEPEQDVVAGAGAGILQDVKENPLKQVALYGGGAGLGFTIGAGISGVAKISPVAGGIVKGSTTIAGAGLGGLFFYDVGKKAYQESRDEKGNYQLAESGKILGVSGKDIFLFGSGYKKGQKGFEQVKGYMKTRGREYIEIPQGEYPTARPQEQLRMFEKNIYPELGDKPGAFHTTSQIFWQGKEIKPQVGTSELPSLYGSTQISTPFARIQGSSSGKINVKNWFKNLFQPISEPGVAYLQPEGFRYNPAVEVKPYIIEGQTFGYTFKYPAKPGYAEVPTLKAEIEALFRPESGKYILSGQNYYTNIYGVRVPIDSFTYGGGGTTTGNIIFKSSAYNLPKTSYSFVSPNIISLVSASSTDKEIGEISVISKSIPEVTTSIKPTSKTEFFSLPSSPKPKTSSGLSSDVDISSIKITPALKKVASLLSSSETKERPGSSTLIKPKKSSKRRYKPFRPAISGGSSGQPPKKKILEESPIFKILGKRFGKFGILAKTKSQKKAEQLAKKFLSTTLGRTTQILKDEQPLEFSELKTFFGREWRPGKKDKFVQIQKAKFSLGRTGEVQEIQYFKRKSGKKRKSKKNKVLDWFG